MVVHVGVSIFLRIEFATFDTLSKKTNYFESLQDIQCSIDINNIDELFKEIIPKVNGDPGSICIFIKYYQATNEIFKKLFKTAQYYGFQNIQIIDDSEKCDFFAIVAQAKYYPKPGNIIWIFEDYDCNIWLAQNEKMIHLTEYSDFDEPPWQSENILADIEEDSEEVIDFDIEPNLILYRDQDPIPFKKMFPKCKYMPYNSDNELDGLIFKARINSKLEPKLQIYNVVSVYDKTLDINIDGTKVESSGDILENAILPATKCFVYKLEHKSSKMKVRVQYGISLDYTVVFTLPNYRKILIIFSIDKNHIFTVKCVDVSKYERKEIRSLRHLLKNLPEQVKEVIMPPSFIFPQKNISVPEAIDNAVGIDLGTTRCCCAVSRRNGIETVALDNTGDRLLPSYVAYDEKKPKCGQIVITRMRNYAELSVFDVKRFIGRSFDVVAKLYDPNWPFLIQQCDIIEIEPDNDEGNHIMQKRNRFYLKIGDLLQTPEDVSATLLGHIKEKAEEFQGQKLFNVVITVPASFTNAQNKATVMAGKLAGFETIHLLPEPVAAAFAYFIDRPIPQKTTLLIVDLGGGTLDVCIFRILDNELVISERSGDSFLGGRDFDNILFDYFYNILENDFDILITQAHRHKLLLECQRIKENLSVSENDNLDVEQITMSMEGLIPITRKAFELMSQDLLERIKENITQALGKSYKTANEINKVLYVGGGCRMPMVKKLLKNKFPQAEHCCETNPDEVVAKGAAYYSQFLQATKQSTAKNKKDCSIM